MTIWYPVEIVEEVLVEIHGCFVPVDFVVLDMEVNRSMPLILRRTFLNTTFAQIDVGAKIVCLNLNGKEAEFEFQPCLMGGVKSWPNLHDIKKLEMETRGDSLEDSMINLWAQENHTPVTQKKKATGKARLWKKKQPTKKNPSPKKPPTAPKMKKVW